MHRDRVVLITGTSRGIGAHLARHFIAKKASVIGLSRSPSRIKRARYRHLLVDIRDERQVREAFAAIRSDYGKVDVLINNAAVGASQFSVLTSLSSAEDVFKTNFMGSFLVTREAAKLMMARRYGRIIMIGSMMVPLAPAGGGMYSASKAALVQWTRVLARELAGQDITCNVLGVSALETGLWAGMSRDKLLALVQGLPQKRLATLKDITNAVDFLSSEASGAITGQTLYLGGAC